MKTLQDIYNVNPPLLQYIRTKPTESNVQRVITDSGEVAEYDIVKGAPIGVMVADRIDGEVKIGWSITNTTPKFYKMTDLDTGEESLMEVKDSFDKVKGKHKAIARMLSSNPNTSKGIPRRAIKQYEQFVERANEYFKHKNSSVTIGF